MDKINTQKTLEKAQSTKPMGIADMIKQSTKELGNALPSHMRPERIVRIALTTLRMNPKLYNCDPKSFLGALFQSAQLGLEPNIEGQAYIIPYNVKGQSVAQFQIGYKGYVELFWRHQSSVALQMETIRKNDAFSYDLGKSELSHVPPLGEDRGQVIGYYAIAHLKNGGRVLKVLSAREAQAHGKRFSKCWDRQKGEFKAYTPWSEHFDEMAMKTVLIKLMKLLPKSIEIQRALAMDETVKTKISSDMFDVPNVDDFVPEPAKVVDAEEEAGTAQE